MEKIIFITATLFIIFSCKAQIIPVEDFENYNQELPNGAYIKDINNLLNKYTGTWKGTYNTKNYEFKIIKYTRVSEIRNLKFDKLLMRYEITASNGTVIENTLNLPNTSNFIIRGSYLSNKGSYVLNYVGFNDCGQNGTIFIRVNGNTMDLFLSVDGELGLDCTTGAVEQVLPVNGIKLTKQ
ncbi:hypothetical protein PG911_03550 [Tenacibaculum ovolyticum]|uniref:DUF6705 family protein n=1 Tax=Tenacibaculum ovolyticum TaxID=104270 RepID=UPI0022F395AD|nr:DUF6705 family protein [Tenacibaculum ovolyticum]WBX77348.1 hypothetical protein PG911_03550 [Tenacibaculum ovolyticum]